MAGTMWGEPVPTPLLIQPGFHAQFLAEPVSTTQLDGATFAYGRFWTVTTGYPATLEEVSPSGQATAAATLEGAYGAWAVAAGPGGTVWAGTYHSGRVFAYNLATGKVRLVARLPGANTVWGLVYDPVDGRMWASTWPDGVWTIDPATGAVARVGVVPGEAGARVLGYAAGEVLGGTYPTMDTVILSAPGMPQVFAGIDKILGGQGQVREIGAYNGHTVVLGANGQLVWIGTAPGAAVAYQTLSDCETLPFAFAGRTVVVRRGAVVPIAPGVPGRYNAVNLPLAGAPLATLPAGKYWSAYGVAGGDFYALASDGTLVHVRPDGQVTESLPALTAQAGIIQTMAATPWGIFGSSYLGGEVWRYADGAFSRFGGLDQVDSIVACGGLVYLGVYPGARLYAYDPTRGWDPPTNPVLVGSAGYPQDRVPGIACAGGQAFIGTVPQDAILGGAVYSSAKRLYPAPLAEQTPVSLAADGRLLAGSLSSENALGTPEPDIPAHLFTLDPATGGAVVVSLGIRQTFAGTLVLGGSVYAASPQYLARWQPATGGLTVRRFSNGSGYSQNWGFTTHFFTAAGRLYLIDNGWLYVVDPATLAATRLLYGVQHVAVAGSYVYLSFYDSRWVVRIAAANLTPANAAWPWNFWYDWRHDGNVWPPPSSKAAPKASQAPVRAGR
jgi:hypothetical protein